ncbi:MAG: hypothetical protein R3E84_03710 [Pseudomonadales bacterium]
MKKQIALVLAAIIGLGMTTGSALALDGATKGKQNTALKLTIRKVRPQLTGPNEGKQCATVNRSTSNSTHTNVELECSDSEGNKYTCVCTLYCTNTCENNKFTTDCTPNNCKAKQAASLSAPAQIISEY